MRAVLVVTLAATVLVQGTPPSPADPPRIYSADAGDSWNRLFAALLTRTVRTRYTSEFTDRGPFDTPVNPQQVLPPGSRLGISTRVFDRREEGDRAVDALYPAFLTYSGPRDALAAPRRGELMGALQAALADPRPRVPLARALMQADLWSAYDVLAATQKERARDLDAQAAAAADQARRLIATLIGRLALTSSEIASLPDNYERARQAFALPDLFRDNGEWLEVAWAPFHVHEDASDNRRATRVLMRPGARPGNVPAFLAAAAREYPPKSLAAVALVERMMLVDRSGRVAASPLTRTVQLRTFTRSADGTPGPASVSELELSRRRILADASSGGFVRFDERAEAYVTTAGNDYGFASPSFPQTEPTISTLRVRCTACHGADNTLVVSFSVHDPKVLPPPRALPQPNDERVTAVARAKEARDDFTRLVAAAFPR